MCACNCSMWEVETSESEVQGILDYAASWRPGILDYLIPDHISKKTKNEAKYMHHIVEYHQWPEAHYTWQLP